MKAQIEISPRQVAEFMANDRSFAVNVLAEFMHEVGDREEFAIAASNCIFPTNAKGLGVSMSILGDYIKEIAQLEMGEDV